MKHFDKNFRLRWVFKICQKLGIDDTCHWMNSVSPLLVDQWIAFEVAEQQTTSSSDMLDPDEALKRLTSGR